MPSFSEFNISTEIELKVKKMLVQQNGQVVFFRSFFSHRPKLFWNDQKKLSFR